MKGERIRVLEAECVLDRHPRESGDPANKEKNLGSRLRGNDGLVLDDDLFIACGDGALRPTRLQRAGRSVLRTGELLRGFPIPKGTILA